MVDLTIGRIPKALAPTTIGDSLLSETSGNVTVNGILHSTGDVLLHGSTSGTVALKAPGAAGTSAITFPIGTTNFTATGGTGQVLRQSTPGGPLTVGVMPAAELSGLAPIATSGSASDLSTGTVPAARMAGSYTGITGVGTLTAGTWTAGIVGVSYGGTGANLAATGGVGQFLRQSATGAAITVAAIAPTDIGGLGAGVAAWLAVPSSANLAAALSDESGSGVAYFQGGDLGTPSAGVLTNTTGLPVGSGIAGLGAGVATFLATPSSANLAAAVTGETGTGALVFGTSPTLTTATLSGITAFAGLTASFPALKRSATELQVRLADDSANAPLSSSTHTVSVPSGTAVAVDISQAHATTYVANNLATGTRIQILNTDATDNTTARVVFAMNNTSAALVPGAVVGAAFTSHTAAAETANIFFQLRSAGANIERGRIAGTFWGIGGSYAVNAPQSHLHVGVTAATARCYNAFPDTSNGSWAYMGDWGGTANVARYGTDKIGTGTSCDAAFLYAGAEQFRLGNAGTTFTAALIQKPAASVTPANNGDLMVQATSNTSLTFKLKGTDGVVRSGAITLA